MSLFISLQSELIKLRRTASLYLTIIAAALIPAMLFLENLEISPDAPKAVPWSNHFLEGRESLNIIILPLYIILTATLLLQTEYRDRTWKQVLTSPQKLLNVFIAKFIIFHLLILLFLFLYNLWMTITGVSIELIHPNLFTGSIDVYEIFIANCQAYFLILGISVIQFWLALRFRNFIASLAIGFCLWFMAPMMIFELNWTFADKYPYSFAILSMLPKYKANILIYQWLSIGFAILFLALAFMDFKVRKVKG